MARWAVSFDICMRLHILFSPLLRTGARAVQNSQPRHHTQVKTVDKRSASTRSVLVDFGLKEPLSIKNTAGERNLLLLLPLVA